MGGLNNLMSLSLDLSYWASQTFRRKSFLFGLKGEDLGSDFSPIKGRTSWDCLHSVSVGAHNPLAFYIVPTSSAACVPSSKT